MSLRDDVLKAARADSIPKGSRGLWVVRKFSTAKELVLPHEGRLRIIPAGNYTQLWCYTEETLHRLGVMVMNDGPDELNTHLNFMLRARGTVLIAGLGLGCCLRGALANPAVGRVTVVERDPSVIELVWPHIAQKERITLIQADAIEWAKNSRRRFDTAWYDLWDNPDLKDEKLPLLHSKLLLHLHGRVKAHGAWAFPRDAKKAWNRIRREHEMQPML